MTEEIIIEVKINEIAGKLAETTAQIQALKKEQKSLDKTTTDGALAFAQNAQSIKDLTNQEKILTSQLTITSKENKALNDSFLAQERELDKMKLQYKAMDSEMRNSKGGKEMKSAIDELDKTVKANSASIGDHQRNVGNYEIAVQKLPGVFGDLQSKAKSSLAEIKGGIESLKNITKDYSEALLVQKTAQEAAQVAAAEAAAAEEALAVAEATGAGTAEATATAEAARATATATATVATEAASAAMKIFKFALASTGIGLLVVAVGALVAYFTKTNEGSKEFAKITSGINAVIQSGIKILGSYGKLLYSIATFDMDGIKKGWSDLTTNVKNATTEIKANYNAGVKNAEAQKMMAARERTWSGQRLLLLKEYEEAKFNAGKKSKLDDEGKIKAAKRALEIDEQIFANDVKIAKNKAKMVEDEQKLNSKVDKQAIQDAKNKVQEIINAHSMQQLTVDALMGKAEQREEAANNAGVESAKEKADRVAKIEADSLKMHQELQDAIISNTKKGIEAEIAQEELSTTRKKEELLKQTGLTKQGIEDRNKLIEQLQIQSDNKIKELTEEAIKAETEKELKRLNILVAGAKKGSQEELDLKLESLKQQEKAELAQKNLTEEEKSAITAKYLTLETEQKNAALQKQNADVKLALNNDFEERKLALVNNAQALADLELEQKRTELANLQALDAEHKAALYESEEAYNAAVIASKGQVIAAEQNVNAVRAEAVQNQLNALSTMNQAFSGLFTEMAGDNAAMQAFLKTLALANIMTNMASGVAAAIKAGAGLVFPANLGAIATGVSAVVGGITNAIATLKSAKTPRAPKFESGGIVGGTSYTGDNVPAYVNSGEMILNRGQQTNLFKLVQNTPQAGGIDYGKLAAAMSTVRPVVSVSEINSVNSRVETLETLGSW